MSLITHAELELIHKWISYFDAQRKHIMDTVETISARLADMEAAAGRIAGEVSDMKAKLDAASVEDPRLAAIADHAAAILDKLNAVAPAPVVEVAAEPVAEQPAQ